MSQTTKSKVSAMVSGAGMAADVWTRLDKAVKAQGGTDEDLHLLAREEGQAMIDQIAWLLVRAGAASRNVFPVTLDYGQSLDQMIAAGNYDYRNDYITAENFPVNGEGKVTTSSFWSTSTVTSLRKVPSRRWGRWGSCRPRRSTCSPTVASTGSAIRNWLSPLVRRG